MAHEPIPMPSGEHTIYAQNANQAVPVYKLSPSYEVFNEPQPQAQAQTIKPIPISLDFINAPNQVMSNPVPQQQLPDTYALPISNQVIVCSLGATFSCIHLKAFHFRFTATTPAALVAAAIDDARCTHVSLQSNVFGHAIE